MSTTDDCNDKDEMGYCLQMPVAHICKGTDTCFRWKQVYATMELSVALKAINSSLPLAGKGD